MSAPTCFSLNWIDAPTAEARVAHRVPSRPGRDDIVTQMHRDGVARAGHQRPGQHTCR